MVEIKDIAEVIDAREAQGVNPDAEAASQVELARLQHEERVAAAEDAAAAAAGDQDLVETETRNAHLRALRSMVASGQITPEEAVEAGLSAEDAFEQMPDEIPETPEKVREVTGMHMVPVAAITPAACALSKTSEGPFVDTGLDIALDGHVYIALGVAEQIAKTIGATTAHTEAALQEQLEDAEKRIEDLLVVEAEYEAFREAVAITLQHGVVIDTKRGIIAIRRGEGGRKSDLPADRVITNELPKETS